jgi:hypothetical protein
MSTLAEITIAIDDNIRNKTPLVVKTEHADVDQLITDQLFPDSVKIEWNGTSSVDPNTDIVVSTATLPTSKCQFAIYFTKLGNRVFYKGAMGSFGSSLQISNATLATFATELYKPLNNLPSRSLIILDSTSNVVPNALILFDRNLGIKIQGTIGQGIVSLHFEGSYKVAN